MKRQANLYSEIISIKNLRIAFWKAAKGKRYKRDVLLYSINLDENIEALHYQLSAERFKVGNYHYFEILEPKRRTICAASFPERIVHHAIMNYCEPIFERFQIFDSYACRKQKGTHKAVEKALYYSQKYRYFLKMDIRKYFDSLDHQVLKKLIRRKLKDRELLSLLDKIIDSYSVSSGKGVPIGNLTSQFFANFHLGFLDHFIKEEIRNSGYIRYMDDLALWSDSMDTLRESRKRISEYLEVKLSLINHEPIFGRTIDGIPFLGYLVKCSGIFLLRKSKNRFIKKYKTGIRLYLQGEWTEEDFCRHTQPLFAYTLIARSRSFRKQVIEKNSLS